MKRLLLSLGVIILLSATGYGQGRTPPPYLQFFTNAGRPCNACQLLTFAAGSSTPLATYSDSALTTANPTTITLNSAGIPEVDDVEVAIYLSTSSYKFTLKDQYGALIRTVDNITAGSTALTYLASGASAVSRTISSKLGDVVSVKDYGADCDGATNDTAAFIAAMNASKRVLVPAGVCKVNIDLSLVTNPSGIILEGSGYGDGSSAGSTLKGYDDTLPIIKGVFTSGTIKRKMQFRNLHFNQSGGSVSSGNHGLQLEYVYEVTLDHCYFINLGGYAISYDHVVRGLILNTEIYKGSASRGVGGIIIADNSTDITFVGGKMTGSGTSEATYATTLSGVVAGISLSGTSIESWGKGAVLDNTNGKISDIHIDAWFEQNNDADVQIGMKDILGSAYPNERFISGVSLRGIYVGPADEDGSAIQLWGSELYSIHIQPDYATTREYLVDLYGTNQTAHNVIIRPSKVYNPVTGTVFPLITGSLAGVTVLNDWEEGVNSKLDAVYDSIATTVSGSATYANKKISYVTGESFFDIGASTTLSGATGQLLTVTDSAAKTITGYVDHLGDGETLGEEGISVWQNFSTGGSPYETFTSSGTTITSAINTTGSGYAISPIPGTGGLPLIDGALYKISITITLNSGTAPQVFLGSSGCSGGSDLGVTALSSGANTKYFTHVSANSTYLCLRNSATTGNWSATTSVKRVTSPSATGVSIKTSTGTFGWESAEAGFNYNDTSGYTYSVKTLSVQTISAETVAADEITTGTEGSADGSIKVYNSTSGYVELAPAAGALGTSKITLPATTGTLDVVSGLSQTIVVKGSDGNNCNLVFVNGKISSTTCP